MVVEACYCIYTSPEKEKRLLVKASENSSLWGLELPCMLTEEEFQEPYRVIEGFFKSRDLRGRKKSLYLWLEAALSNFNIEDEYEVSEMLAYVSDIEKLLEAANRVKNIKTNRAKREKYLG